MHILFFKKDVEVTHPTLVYIYKQGKLEKNAAEGGGGGGNDA